MDPKGFKGTSVSDNRPVGTAGQPAVSDANSIGRSRRGQMNDGRSKAIGRRLAKLNQQRAKGRK